MYNPQKQWPVAVLKKKLSRDIAQIHREIPIPDPKKDSRKGVFLGTLQNLSEQHF